MCVCVCVSVSEKKQEDRGDYKSLKQKRKHHSCLHTSCLGRLGLPRSLRFQVSHISFSLFLSF